MRHTIATPFPEEASQLENLYRGKLHLLWGYDPKVIDFMQRELLHVYARQGRNTLVVSNDSDESENPPGRKFTRAGALAIESICARIEAHQQAHSITGVVIIRNIEDVVGLQAKTADNLVAVEDLLRALFYAARKWQLPVLLLKNLNPITRSPLSEDVRTENCEQYWTPIFCSVWAGRVVPANPTIQPVTFDLLVLKSDLGKLGTCVLRCR